MAWSPRTPPSGPRTAGARPGTLRRNNGGRHGDGSNNWTRVADAPNDARGGDRRRGAARRGREPGRSPDVPALSGAVAAAVSLLAAEPVHERPERARLLRRRVASLLSVAARRWNRLGA